LQLGDLFLDHVGPEYRTAGHHAIGGKRPLWVGALSYFLFYQTDINCVGDAGYTRPDFSYRSSFDF
jgi:hypothetical protein